MPFFDVYGVKLHYAVAGGGEPIVLLHGFTSSFGGNWVRRGWVDLLTENAFRVLGLDFRPRSERPRLSAERVHYRNAVTDVVGLLDHLEVERANVFGFSMGGGVALKLAMDAPERVDRIVVSGVGDAALNRFHDPAEIESAIVAFQSAAASVSTGG